MKKAVFACLSLVFLWSCDPEEVETKTRLELISQSTWTLENITGLDGELLTAADLNTQSLLLFAMDYTFLNNGEVRGIDKASGNILQKGIWQFINEEKSVNVVLGTLDYDFEIGSLKSSRMSLIAPTGNFLTGVGDKIVLNFTAK